MRAVKLPDRSVKDVLAARDSRRSPGVHVSDLYALVIKKIDPNLYDAEYNQIQRENWMHTGFIWEKCMDDVFRGDNIVRPGEFVCDGVIISPDGIAIDNNGVLCLVESKLTWKSSREFDDPTPAAGLDLLRFLSWKLQMMAYCYVLSLHVAILHVLFVNGDYTTRTPVLHSYALVFDQRELTENWTMLLNTGKKAGLL